MCPLTFGSEVFVGCGFWRIWVVEAAFDPLEQDELFLKEYQGNTV
jgi:hypothetical protein